MTTLPMLFQKSSTCKVFNGTLVKSTQVQCKFSHIL